MYTVTFKGPNGMVFDVQNVIYGGFAVAPTPLTIPGYTFNMWDKNFSNITQNTVVNAVYEVNYIQLSFNPNGGSYVPKMVVPYGSTVTLPKPTKEGYTFTGWYYGSDVNDGKFTSQTQVKEDLVLVARWEINTYSVELNWDLFGDALNGLPLNMSVNHGDYLRPPYPGEVLWDYFGGWFFDDSLTMPVGINTIVNQNYQLYAKWNIPKAEFSFSLDTNGYRIDKYLGSKTEITTPELYDGDRGVGFVQSLHYFTFFETPIEIFKLSRTIIDSNLNWKTEKIHTILVDDRNPHFVALDGVLYTKDFETLVLYPNGKAVEESHYFVPEGVRFIRFEAFGSAKLSHITLPSTFEEFNFEMMYMSIIEKLNVSPDNPYFKSIDGILYNKDVTELVRVPKYIHNNDFGYRYSYTLPNTVTKIRSYAFSSVVYIDAFKLEENTQLQYIGDYAFSGSYSIKTFEFSPILTHIGDYAFSNMFDMKEIILPQSIKYIGNKAFYNNGALTTLYLPNTIEYMGDLVFENDDRVIIFTSYESIPQSWNDNWNANQPYLLSSEWYVSEGKYKANSSELYLQYRLNDDLSSYSVSNVRGNDLGNVIIPNTYKGLPVIGIDRDAFRYSNSLVSVVIPNSITFIGETAFSDCDNLVSVLFEEGSNIRHLKLAVFQKTPKLESINLDALTKLETIGRFAFLRSYSLEHITIPDTVYLIGHAAFSEMNSLQTVTISPNSNLEIIVSFAFEGSHNLNSIFLPNTVEFMGDHVFSGGLTIYADFASKPKSWSNNWSGSATVIWGPHHTKEYTVNFADFEGYSFEPITSNYGIAVSKPEEPYANIGYELVWYMDSNFKKPFDFSRMPSADVTLYARWERILQINELYSSILEFVPRTYQNELGQTIYIADDYQELVSIYNYMIINMINKTTVYVDVNYPNYEIDVEERLVNDSFIYKGGNFNYIVSYSCRVAERYVELWVHSKVFELSITLNQENGFFPSVNTKNFVSSRPNNFDGFAIESIDKTISVSTSDQLYYAMQYGYRPIPVSGSQAELVYEAAKDILRQIIDDTMTDFEKVEAMYAWMTTNIAYDYLATILNPPGGYNAYYAEGALLDKKAVCGGYAKAFVILANIEGIQTIHVLGTSHAWNKVFINGAWYIIDTTWGATKVMFANAPSYQFFLVNDDYLTLTHESQNFIDVVALGEYNYYTEHTFTYESNVYDYYIVDLDELAILINYFKLYTTEDVSIDFQLGETLTKQDVQNYLTSQDLDYMIINFGDVITLVYDHPDA